LIAIAGHEIVEEVFAGRSRILLSHIPVAEGGVSIAVRILPEKGQALRWVTSMSRS